MMTDIKEAALREAIGEVIDHFPGKLHSEKIDAVLRCFRAASIGGGVELPADIAEHVLSLGRVEWGQTLAHDAAGHGAHIANSVRLTAESFKQDAEQHMHGLWLAGTETVLCHTGTSPNAPKTTQALVGAWNWLVDQASGTSDGTCRKCSAAPVEPVSRLCAVCVDDVEGKSRVGVDRSIAEVIDIDADYRQEFRLFVSRAFAELGDAFTLRVTPVPGKSGVQFYASAPE